MYFESARSCVRRVRNEAPNLDNQVFRILKSDIGRVVCRMLIGGLKVLGVSLSSLSTHNIFHQEQVLRPIYVEKVLAYNVA